MKPKLKVLRAAVTRTVNKLEAACAAQPVDNTDVRCLVELLKSHMDELEEFTAQYETTLENLTEEEQEVEFDRITNYRENAKCAIIKAKLMLESLDDNKVDVNSSLSHVASHRLPKLELPTFDGDILKWNDFYECFQLSIDKAPISDVEKFSYLKQYLTGEALNTVSGLSLSGANYASALALLNSRYGCKRRLIRAHIRQLLGFPCPNFESVQSLRKFVDHVKLNIRGLAALNVATDHYEIFLCEILMSKVSHETKFEWAKLDDSNMTLESLLHIVETEAKTLDLVQSTSDKPKKLLSVKSHYVANSNVPFCENNKPNKCRLCCSNQHFANSCPSLINIADVSKRYSLIKKAHLCFNCLGPHHIKDCVSKHRCSKCQKKHHSLLHNTNFVQEKPEANSTQEVKSHSSACSQVDAPCLPIVAIALPTQSGYRHLGALLDTGAERSFILEDELPNIVHNVLKRTSITIRAFSDHTFTKKCKIIETSLNGEVCEFIATDKVCASGIEPSNATCLVKYGLTPCPTPDSNRVSLVIGCDHYYKLVTGNIKRLSNSLVAVETIYGWTTQGFNSNFDNLSVNCMSLPQDDIKKFWDLELSGILPIGSIKPSETKSEPVVFLQDGRYCANYPWNDHLLELQTYEKEARARLFQTYCNPQRQKHLASYDAIFQDYAKQGIIEEVPADEDNPPCRYLPHHPVTKNDKATTKIRIVFDASAKAADNLSLNDCMSEGENLFPDILGILTRFRMYQHALTADVEKAFLQISIPNTDRNYVRFFWFRDLNALTIGTYRFTRVVFGLKASPFLLSYTINHHLNKMKSKYDETVSLLQKSMYVDDLMTSRNGQENLNKFKRESIAIFDQMKMNLRKWNSNVPDVCDQSDGPPTKVLGLTWENKSDSLSVNFPNMQKPVATKRQLASLTCSFFDPLGLFSPFVLQFKLLLQEVWAMKLDWDDVVPETIKEKVHFLRQFCETINSFKVPRCLQASLSVELHGFSDASSKAYGCVIYLRTESKFHLVASKTRLAPSNKITLPRMELLGCLITARLTAHMAQEMEIAITRCHAWSDSKVALAWIEGKKRYKDFVNNRVIEIRSLIPSKHWNYIPTSCNPADLTTRVIPVEKWLLGDLWWHGPELPVSDSGNMPSLNEDEIKSIDKESQKIVLTNKVHFKESVVDFSRFSQFKRLRNALGYVLRFIHPPYSSDSSQDTNSHRLSLLERASGEILALRLCQEESFPSEVHQLQDGANEVSNKSRIYQLSPFIDDNGLLRRKSRVSESANLTYDEKFPIILPSDHRVTELLIRDCHSSMIHSGTGAIMHKLRDKYHIVRFRQTVKRILNQCIVCRRFSAKPLRERFAPLPIDRCDPILYRPFENCGVDYFGPLTAMVDSKKLYVLLFTCLNVRAVHMEICTSLDAKEFLNAFERFTSRRGLPRLIRSDNAKTFVSGAKLLEDKYSIMWKFSTPKAPWEGGCWERMIRSVKNAMKHVSKSKLFTYSDLSTQICKIESVINQRPITYQNDDDDLKSLSPSDFLLPKKSFTSDNDPAFHSSCLASKRDILLSGLIASSKMISTFWKRWKQEYLRCLVDNKSTRNGPPLKVDDIVLLDDGSKRQFWPLCRVTELYAGRDGKVRSVKLKLSNKFLVRPIKLLYNLEIR